MKPSVLRIENSSDIDIIAAVVDLSPSQDKPQISISIEKQVSSEAIPRSGLLWLTALPTLKNVRSNVVENLRGRQSPNQWLVPVSGLNYKPNRVVPVSVPIAKTTLDPNPSQVKAINSGAGTDDYLLVLGPPGTGKTTVILRWVEYFVSKGKRVLVTSQNNKAVDNVLERLAEEKSLECIRLGDETKVSSSVKDILIDNYATTIQKKLISDISTTISDCKAFIAYLDNLAKILKQYEVLKNQAINFEDRAQNIRDKILPKTRQDKSDNSNMLTALESALIDIINELNDSEIIYNTLDSIIDFADYRLKVNSNWNEVKYTSIVPHIINARHYEVEAQGLFNKDFIQICTEKSRICSDIRILKTEIGNLENKIDDLTKDIIKLANKSSFVKFVLSPISFYKKSALKNYKSELDQSFVKIAHTEFNLRECDENGRRLIKKIAHIDLKLKTIRQDAVENRISELKTSIDRLDNMIETLTNETFECDQVAKKRWDDGLKSFEEIPKSILKYSNLIKIESGKNFNYKKYEENRALCSKLHTNILKIIEGWFGLMSSERQQALYSLLLSFVDVVGATCIGINTNRAFKDVVFDVVIVDESGQIQLHNVMVPLSRGPKAILVGDHKQLPPVVQKELLDEIEVRGDYDQELIKKSWFEILWDQSPDDRKVMLNTQFRCPAIISDFISQAYYDNEYFAGENTKKKAPLFTFFSSTLVFIDTSKLKNRFEKSVDRTVMGNQKETEIVLSVLSRALQELPYLGSGEVGIIVPYKNHVMEIRTAIRKQMKIGKFKEITAPLDEFVATVDSFQGQERDLIIFPFTRSNHEGRIGFIRDWRRLNVAMTRTKKQLVMIGDISTLTKIPRNKEMDEMETLFRKSVKQLAEYSKKHGQFIDAAELFAVESFNSDLKTQV